MTQTPLAPIGVVLDAQRGSVGQEWLTEIFNLWNRHYPGLVTENELRGQIARFLTELNALFAAHGDATPPQVKDGSPLVELVRELSTQRAKLGFKPIDTVSFLMTLKKVLTQRLASDLSQSPGDLVRCLSAIDDVLDRLSIATFDAFVEVRERVIVQQSMSLMELSTPVILLWDRVLMLPLVGVIDTLRARQFTERLLEAITRVEATVTILDVTGVPVFDTSVARHIMKTVDAAQLLGTRIVMTGISPEGAQTLTKLGISFDGVISRASLRSGLAEAFRMIGKRVVGLGASANGGSSR